jgi:hypothetical protein
VSVPNILPETYHNPKVWTQNIVIKKSIIEAESEAVWALKKVTISDPNTLE